LRRANPQSYKRVLADDQGGFAFDGIRPGNYKVFAWNALPQGQAEQNPSFLVPYESLGTNTTIEPGPNTIDVRLAGVLGPGEREEPATSSPFPVLTVRP
jgi:hypothetical protein